MVVREGRFDDPRPARAAAGLAGFALAFLESGLALTRMNATRQGWVLRLLHA